VRLVKTPTPAPGVSGFRLAFRGSALGENTKRGGQDPDWGDAYQMEEPELPEVEWDVRTIEVYMPNLDYDPNQA